MHRTLGVLQVTGEVEGEDVHREDPRLAGPQRGQRFLMRVVVVGGEDDERLDARLLPGAEQLVHPAVQRLAPHGRVAGVGALGSGIDAILYRRRAQDAELGGEVVGEALDEDGVTPQREMGSVLLTGADGHEEAGVALERGPHLVRNEGLQVQRIAHLVVAGCLAAVAAAEWLHGGAPAWAWASATAGRAASALVAPRHSRRAAAGWLRDLRARRLACWARAPAALARLAPAG